MSEKDGNAKCGFMSCDPGALYTKGRSVHNISTMDKSYILTNASLVLPDRVVQGGALVVRDGFIEAVAEPGDAELGAADPSAGGRSRQSLPTIDLDGKYVLPRLLEMHIHGCFGIGFEQISGGEDLRILARKLASRGVGAFVPTILWEKNAVRRLVESIEVSGFPRSVIPGIHIEGPFVNPAKRGGISLANISPIQTGLLEEILETTRGYLKIMTLAPELPGAEAVYKRLKEAGVLVSLGHSDARGQVVLPRQAFSVTHLFNAMSGVDHRADQEGLANRALAGLPAWVELNADGIHVNRTAMKLARSAVAPDSLILTSDAVVSAGLPFGEYKYFGVAAFSGTSGVRYKETGTLIGSSRIGMEIVKSYMDATGAPLAHGVAAMSDNPSRALGLAMEHTGGRIAAGAAANFYIWDATLASCTPASSLEGAK